MATSPVSVLSLLQGRAIGSVLAILAAGTSTAFAQSPLRTLPGLTEVAVYEVTAGVTRNAFAPDALTLTMRHPVLNASSRDFSHAVGEYYDVFYSDANGTPDSFGEFLTIEAVWTGSENDGSMNITGAELVVGSQRLLADSVRSYRLGSRCVPVGCNADSRHLSVDGDLGFSTIPRMGATQANEPADRIRLTLGFPRPSGTTLVLNPVAPVTRGTTLTLSWNNVGAASYNLGVTSGPGLAGPIVLGTVACCAVNLPVPIDTPPGIYQMAVAAGNIVSAPVEVVILSNLPTPVLAPIPPVARGGPLTFIWTPNGAPNYDVTVISGPGISGFLPLGPAPCCSFTLQVPANVPTGTYQAVVRGNGVQSAPVSFTILGSSGTLELGATSTIVRPGTRTTLSWTDRGANAGPMYDIFAGPVGATTLGRVLSQGCCLLEVPWGAVATGSYDVYVQDSTGLRSNRVTIRFDP